MTLDQALARPPGAQTFTFGDGRALCDVAIIDPRKTREVLFLPLSAALNAPIEPMRLGVFRMCR